MSHRPSAQGDGDPGLSIPMDVLLLSAIDDLVALAKRHDVSCVSVLQQIADTWDEPARHAADQITS